MTTEIKKLKPSDEIIKNLASESSPITQLIPDKKKRDRFLAAGKTALIKNPKLAQLDRTSLYDAFMDASAQNLLPDGKHGAIVEFKGKAKWMVMTAGLMKLARNSGEIKSISMDVVFKGDEFSYWTDEEGVHMRHVPNLFGDRGERLGAYAVVKTKDDGIYMEFMTEAQLMDVKRMSRSGDRGPWGGPFADEMRKKTLFRRIAKRLPMSTDLEEIISKEDEEYDLTKLTKNVTPEEPKTSKLAQLVEAVSAETPAIEDEKEVKKSEPKQIQADTAL